MINVSGGFILLGFFLLIFGLGFLAAWFYDVWPRGYATVGEDEKPSDLSHPTDRSAPRKTRRKTAKKRAD